MRPFTEILQRPIVTEKSQRLQEENKYLFEVASKANRTEVKRAVEQAFNVRVVNVNVLIVPGKQKRYGFRVYRTPDRKKAVVQLKQGDKIELFEGV